jgi:FixJ family two-component response regulator
MNDHHVIIVDDDAEIRGSLDSLLREMGYNVRTHQTTEEFMAAGRPDAPSCLVLDIRLPGENGLDFQERMNAEGVTIPVIFITGHGNIPMTVRGMRGGAVDFLPKPFDEQQMLDAIDRAIKRDREGCAERALTARLEALYDQLSRREREVMSLVVTGLMNKQVAARLSLSEITVKIHRGSVMRKMQAQSLADLVRMAEQLCVRDETIQRFSTPAQAE